MASVALMWLGPVVPVPVLRPVGFLVSALLIPLALILVPVFWFRRVIRQKRTAAWELIITVIAAVGLAVVSMSAGEDQALEKRGRWVEAVVTKVDDRKTDRCELRTRDGREISPRLSEGDGCDADIVQPGDELRVLVDPEGMAGPADEMPSGSYVGAIVGLAALVVATGTCGCVRLRFWDNADDNH
ncbi:hypothetical protein AB0I82_12150 [Streptomyces sp. NPDC050315]|uniref:hypothetical protein n=1 Tax=Streptomyces sp. NPDC050315 TaxID=3155039 RepID=UPI0034344AB2